MSPQAAAAGEAAAQAAVAARASRDGGAAKVRENLYLTDDVGPYTEGVQRGLELKDLRDLKDLTMHDVQLIGDEETTGRRNSLRNCTDHH